METQALQHPDFIWTWRETSRGKRQTIWVPYLQSIARIPRKKWSWKIRYNGGELDVNLKLVEFIMLYEACGDIPVEFLDELNSCRIGLAVHRRNMPRPSLFIPAAGGDSGDILSAQIMARTNETKSTYVSRTLVREKLASCEWLIPVSDAQYTRLAASRSVASVRLQEATHAARYWRAYYRKLGIEEKRREAAHPVNSALDACSFFLQGIVLRWVLFHGISPFHGFLHRPTDYVSLVFDLMEPYRWWIDRSVAEAAAKVGCDDDALLTAAAVEELKDWMEIPVYVPATRQTVRRKSLLHGVVLGTRAWLAGDQVRFVIPVEGEKKGGRPPAVGFSIPGYASE